MLNCGGIVDLSDIFPDVSSAVTFYVVDSHRPLNLENVYSESQVASCHSRTRVFVAVLIRLGCVLKVLILDADDDTDIPPAAEIFGDESDDVRVPGQTEAISLKPECLIG